MNRPNASASVLRALLILVVGSLSLVAAPEIVAHRGASHAAPENTIAAFDLAWELGADVIEGDFLLTADGEVVCIHDKSTERLANENLVVSKSTLAELQALDVGSWKGEKWAGARIPTIDQILKAMPEDRGRIFVEIKDSARIVEPLAKKIRASGMDPGRINIICFDEQVIAACKAAMPEIGAHWLVSAKTFKSLGLDGVITKLKACGADGVDFQANRELNAEVGRQLQANNLEFHCWTVNDATMARYMAACGVDSITTDKPAQLRSWLIPKTPTPGTVLKLSFDEPNDAGPHVEGIRGKALSETVRKTAITLPGEGTVALWYRPVSWYNYQSIFDNTAHENVWEMWIDENAQIGFRTTANDVRLTYRLHKVASKDQWQHLTVTWSSDKVVLYLNGVVVNTATRKNAEAPDPGFFCLGGGHPNNIKAKGAWDDVIILDDVMPPEHVRTLMLYGPEVLP